MRFHAAGASGPVELKLANFVDSGKSLDRLTQPDTRQLNGFAACSYLRVSIVYERTLKSEERGSFKGRKEREIEGKGGGGGG